MFSCTLQPRYNAPR